MKKILILQNKGNSIGGIWFVNQTLATSFSDLGYEVEVLSVRNVPGKKRVKENKKFKINTINSHNLWEITHKSDVLKSIKKFSFFRTLYKYIVDNYKLKKDYKKLSNYIINYNPNYIIISHYELIKAVPKKYLIKSIYHHHTSLRESIKNRSIRKTLTKFNNKIRFLFLTKSTQNEAIKRGLKKCYYIYNPIKFSTSNKSDVVNNKKLITITRISSEKRLDLMINIVKKAFQLLENKDWTFELYGDGNVSKQIIELCDGEQIKYMGITDDPKSKLLKGSINLNTSIFEGFSLSILEAAECGLPTITFDFGESVAEQIIDGKTGYIIEQNNFDEYVNCLVDLIKNPKKLGYLSYECKKFSKNFNINSITKKWLKLFEEMDSD